MSKKTDALNFDPYDLLGLSETCQEKDIVKAFRKKALEFHPDKNPGRKEFAEAMFLKISKAFEILTDAAAKSALDRLKKAQRQARDRTKLLDAKRRKLKEELEGREAGLQQQRDDEQLAQHRLQKEIERLRKEGSSLLQKEREELERRMKAESAMPSTAAADSPPRLKAQWKLDGDSDSEVYNRDLLISLFSKYGEVIELVVSKKKKKKATSGLALIEFAQTSAATSAWNNEKGLLDCPLNISWVSGKPESPKTFAHADSAQQQSTDSIGAPPQTVPHRDFESVVLMKLRQAEERKRLIAEMQKEDESSGGQSCDL